MRAGVEGDILTYLHDNVAPVTWQLHIPQRGFSSAKRFIARSPHHTVFVKLNSDDRRLQILSDAKLAPQLLAGGAFGDTRITVQEFIEGQHPTRQWYADNAAIWATLMHTLSQLSRLRDTLPLTTDETYQSLLARYIGQVTAIYTPGNLSQQEQSLVERLLTNYAARLPFIQGAGLVPVHGDPNADNMLITPSHVYLVDWDTLHLSDPMRDVALVLWWMYLPSHWQELLDLFQIDLNDEAQQERFYLYISVWALEVALFFANAQQKEWKQRFLRDAQDAYARKRPKALLIT
jgi:thiamine kinase-like enzyme